MSQQNIKGYKLPKSKLHKLFSILQKKSDEIIAPVKRDNDPFLRMQAVNSPDEICYEGISWFTSKKYIFPEKQELFSFEGNKINTWNEKPPKRTLFGLRLCDLNAFYVNDKLFLHEEPAMEFYKIFRASLTLIGLWCEKAQDKYCFCSSMNLQDRYDLCLFDRGDFWHVKVGSEKGTDIISPFVKEGLMCFFSTTLEEETYSPTPPKCKSQLKTYEIKNLLNKSELWKKGAKDCLSCGDCTTLCPTCLCFDIEDESDLSLKCGKRCAKWDSCMYKDFTLVAGGHAFRDKLEDRFRHRISHKLQYFREQFKELMCTGCGRCIRGCPTKIDWLDLINSSVKNPKKNTNIK